MLPVGSLCSFHLWTAKALPELFAMERQPGSYKKNIEEGLASCPAKFLKPAAARRAMLSTGLEV